MRKYTSVGAGRSCSTCVGCRQRELMFYGEEEWMNKIPHVEVNSLRGFRNSIRNLLCFASGLPLLTYKKRQGRAGKGLRKILVSKKVHLYARQCY